ncbi:sigma-70 family RNA polymerase sigma factor [Paenibacillus endoradicis]|uniref:sigma-70 family RNA polymerase sigma factor n=1 Tax=Paenibacillus endoradicis TaxID=2972487 RepID=UPI0021594703|nr:sigma-70 family RNA polymerase sigma factor [Paenibacillus endoradicis]MCR8658686.1 sigma-70 family RNA polymerase sigma factor [Paenibacillus endoradicis]
MAGVDAELIDRVRNGDNDAFSELISKYANAVYGVAYGKLGNFHAAEDIAQEVFLKTYRRLSNVKEPEKLGSWLYAVTTRECMDWFRSRKSKTVYELVDQLDTPQLETTEDKLLRKELQSEVWDALNTLSEANRTVTILYYIDDYKIREISDFLSISVEAVESRLRRSRKLLKKEMLRMVNENLNENKLNEQFKKKVFEDERMTETQFRRIAMGESDFDDIDMYKTRFYNINLEGSKFDNINMSKTYFNDINMHLAKFEEVGLWDIEIGKCAMGGAYFHDIALEGKSNRFENVELTGTTFRNCNLSNVDIKDCDTTGLTINGISIEALLESYNNK